MLNDAPHSNGLDHLYLHGNRFASVLVENQSQSTGKEVMVSCVWMSHSKVLELKVRYEVVKMLDFDDDPGDIYTFFLMSSTTK